MIVNIQQVYYDVVTRSSSSVLRCEDTCACASHIAGRPTAEPYEQSELLLGAVLWFPGRHALTCDSDVPYRGDEVLLFDAYGTTVPACAAVLRYPCCNGSAPGCLMARAGVWRTASYNSCTVAKQRTGVFCCIRPLSRRGIYTSYAGRSRPLLMTEKVNICVALLFLPVFVVVCAAGLAASVDRDPVSSHHGMHNAQAHAFPLPGELPTPDPGGAMILLSVLFATYCSALGEFGLTFVMQLAYMSIGV